MSNEIETKRAERVERVKKAIALEKPDRVPFAPKCAGIYAMAYDIPLYAVLKDLRNIKPGIKQFFEDVEVDLAWAPILYPIDPMSALGAAHMHFPGPDFGIPLDYGFQIHDDTYIEVEEFDEFCFDPTHFILTKFFPRKFKALKGFENLNFENPTEYNVLLDLVPLANPETQAAFKALQQAAEYSATWAGELGEVAGYIAELGMPLGPAMAQTCPFDMFADNFRGIMRACMDTYEYPDELLPVIKTMERICIDRTVTVAESINAEYVFIPLHNGVDEFMSPEVYEKFYWPGLKAMIMSIIESGRTPYIFCEGKYNTRLEILRDVPKGKVVYMFESVDIKEAKEALGDVACIGGNFPTASLIYSNPKQIKEDTKRMLDDCMGDGGFIMDCSIVLETAKRENMIAWYEATLEYGKY